MVDFKRLMKIVKENRTKISYILLGIILLSLFLYQIINVIGPSYFGDDTVYLFYANQAVHGTFLENMDVFSLRIMNIFPIAFFFALSGINLWSDAAWAILSFFGSAVVAFLLGRELYNDYVGLLSSLLLSFFPLFAVLSGTPSPNIPEAFLTGLAILAFVYGEKRKSRVWYFVSGVSLIASILVTPASGIIFFVLGSYIVIEFARKKFKINSTSLFLAYGIAIGLVVLLLYNYVTVKNPLITFARTAVVYSTAGTQAEGVLVNTDLGYYFGVMFPYHIIAALQYTVLRGNLNLLSIWQTIYAQSYNFVGFYFYAVVLCSVYLLGVREKRAYLPFLWLVVGFLYLEFGPIYVSLSPFTYLLTHRLERYLTIIGIPIVLIISMALFNIGEKVVKSKYKFLAIVPALFALFIIATANPITQMWHTITGYETFDLMSVARYLEGVPTNTRIYFESGFSLVPVYMGYSNLSRFLAYDNIQNCAALQQNSYVIIPKYMQAFNLVYTPNPTNYCPGWQLVLVPQINGSYPTYVTAPSQPFGAKLYYIPTGGNYSAH